VFWHCVVTRSPKPSLTVRGNKLGRVTRLGEFSPLGWLFTVDNFYKIKEVAQNFILLFPRKSCGFLFVKKWVGLHLGWLFHELIWSPWSTGAWRGTLKQLFVLLLNMGVYEWEEQRIVPTQNGRYI
jgi:hypothetical protein